MPNFVCRPVLPAFLYTCVLIAIFSGLSSCASLGLATPKTFNDNLALVHTSHGIASDLSASALRSKLITLSRATEIRDELATIKDDLSAIEDLGKAGQTDTAAGKLKAVRTVLLKLRAEMGDKK